LNTSTSTFRRIMTAGILSGALVGLTACGPVNTLRAKDWLNTGVRDFNRGKYDEAEKSFTESLRLNPDDDRAKLFFAMTLNAKFRRSASEDLGLKTIAAYQDVIKTSQDADQTDKAYAFIADVYKQMGDMLDPKTDAAKVDQYKEQRRKWLLDRGNLPGQKDQVKAQMLYSVGQSYWEEANDIVKVATKPPAVAGQGPTIELTDQERAHVNELINKGHEYMDQAVTKDPEYADAFAYKKVLFTLESRITSDEARKKDLANKITEYDEIYREKASAQRAREAAAAAEAGAAAEKGEGGS
jgi:tetratricopeptide (TPR) repeat protein